MNKPEISIDATVYNRIPFGAEQEYDGDDACVDCGVQRGEFHLPKCDQEMCPRCGTQLLSCDCEAQVVEADGDGGSEAKEISYDAPRTLASSEVGRRLDRVADLLRFANAGLGAMGRGGQGAGLLLQEAMKELGAVTECNVLVQEQMIPF